MRKHRKCVGVEVTYAQVARQIVGCKVILPVPACSCEKYYGCPKTYCVLRIAYSAGNRYAIRGTQYAFQTCPSKASRHQIGRNEENVAVRRFVIYEETDVRQHDQRQ